MSKDRRCHYGDEFKEPAVALSQSPEYTVAEAAVRRFDEQVIVIGDLEVGVCQSIEAIGNVRTYAQKRCRSSSS